MLSLQVAFSLTCCHCGKNTACHFSSVLDPMLFAQSLFLLNILRITWLLKVKGFYLTVTVSSSCFSCVGCRAWWEESAADPPERERRQPGGGRRAAEGPFHGCGQSQEVAAPSVGRDRKRVSLFISITVKLQHRKTFSVNANRHTWN